MGEDDAYRDDVCYNLQQAIEMSLKAMVELNGLQYAENHDVRANLNILNRNNIQVPLQEELRSIASTVYSWETESRYKDSFVSLIEDIDQALNIAREYIKYVESMIGEEMIEDPQTMP